MLLKNTALALGACLSALCSAREVSVVGDISDLHVQKVMDAFYDAKLFPHLDFDNGPQLSAIAVMNHSSSDTKDPFGMTEMSFSGLSTRDSITCDTSGSPNAFGRFLEDNKSRVANAAGSLAAALPGTIYLYIEKVHCRENVACSVIFGFTALAAGTYTYTEVQTDVGTAIDNIHSSCASQKGTDSSDDQTLRVRISTTSDQTANCASTGHKSSNCREVKANQ